MRISFVSLLFAATLAFILASAPATAALIVAIDDPSVPGLEIVIHDGGAFDQSPETTGLITVSGSIGAGSGVSAGGGGGATIALTATNLLTLTGGPNLFLDVQSFSTNVQGLNLLVTDTDLDLIEGNGQVVALGEAAGGDTISFDFYGDSTNDPFGKGFIIDEFTEGGDQGPLGAFIEFGGGPTEPVGSATILVQTAFADDQIGNVLTASYITTLTVTPAAVPIPAAVWLFGSALGLLGWTKRRAT